MSTDAESPRENRSTLPALAVFVDRRTLVMLALGFKASALAQVLTAVGAPRAADAVRAAWASGAGVLVDLSLDLGFTLTEIAEVRKIFGVAMTIAGVFAGGFAVARYGLLAELTKEART